MLIAAFIQGDISQVPVVLGPLGTIISGLILFGLAVLNAVQFYKAKNVQRLESALNASEVERKVHEESSVRKTKELADANQKIGELSAKTNLEPLMERLGQGLEMANTLITLTNESLALSRKLEREIAQVVSNVSASINRMIESNDENCRQNTAALEALTEEILRGRKGNGVK